MLSGCLLFLCQFIFCIIKHYFNNKKTEMLILYKFLNIDFVQLQFLSCYLGIRIPKWTVMRNK